MATEFGENLTAASRRRSASRHHSLQATLDKLLGTKLILDEEHEDSHSDRENEDKNLTKKIKQPESANANTHSSQCRTDDNWSSLPDKDKSYPQTNGTKTNQESPTEPPVATGTSHRSTPDSYTHQHSQSDRSTNRSQKNSSHKNDITNAKQNEHENSGDEKTDWSAPTIVISNSIPSSQIASDHESGEKIELGNTSTNSSPTGDGIIHLAEKEDTTSPRTSDKVKEQKFDQRRRHSSDIPTARTTTEKTSVMNYSKDRPMKVSQSVNSAQKRLSTSLSLFDIHNATKELAIRRTAYRDWLMKKQQILKAQEKEEAIKKKNEAEKAKQQEIKRRESLAAYTSWKKKKDDQLRQSIKKQREKVMDMEKEQKQKQENKVKDAEKMFESWKRTKENSMSASIRERKKSESVKSEKKQEEERQKRDDALKAFQEWKRKRDEEIYKFSRLLKKAEQQQHEELFSAQIERDMEAQKCFEIWLEQKERERVDKAMLAISPSSPSTILNETALLGQFKPPWIPSNPTIPRNTCIKHRQRQRHIRSRSAGAKR